MLNEIIIGLIGLGIVCLGLSIYFIIKNMKFEKQVEIPLINLGLGSLALFLILFLVDILIRLVDYDFLKDIAFISHDYTAYFISLGLIPLIFIFYIVMIFYVREMKKNI